MKLIEELVNDYQTYAIVVKDYAGKGSRRCERIARLIDEIRELAVKRKVKVKSFSRAQVKESFAESGARTKQEIAVGITKRFPRAYGASPAFQKTLDERRLPDEYF